MSDDPRDDPTVASNALPDDATRSAHGSSQSFWPGSTQPALEAGQCIGRYRVIRLLGRGGMGEVYEAEDVDSGRRLALKLLSRLRPGPQDRKRFLREGRLAASISHPNCVYVFGTDAIDESLVMTMELVSGGTLRDRVVQEGPFRPAEAVDSILQAARGLRTAHLAGILHRDIKPSNLFVNAEGQVKVGDFGLSISMSASEETHLTATGTFLGTPSYASPEQMRGAEGDVRSDIYSLGATLYYLLTGRAPFEADNPVTLVAAVLEEAPLSPATIRPEVPKGLAQVVLRCLEKKPANRFADYDALLKALTAYGSAAQVAANPGMRLFAVVMDGTLYSISAMLLQTFHLYSVRASPVFLLINSLVWITYWFLLDVWGGSVGKWILGMRVVGPDGHRPAPWRALVRAAIFAGVPGLPMLILALILGEKPLVALISEGAGSLVSFSSLAVILMLMSTARRRNGFAGVHELASGTRVVNRTAYEARPVGVGVTEAVAAPTGERFGVYAVLDAPCPVPGLNIVQAYDEPLHRRVWIHRRTADSPALASGRRDLDRPARLRWLNGGRADPERWDAYEAPGGCSLPAMLVRRRPWATVRYWLLDLATELEGAVEDGSLGSSMELDDVWITSDGRLRVLDFCSPGAAGADEGSLGGPAAQRFLARVAVSALEGRPLTSAEARGRPPHVPLPLSARAVLTRLGNADYVDLAAAVQDIRPLATSRPDTSRGSRLAQIALALVALSLMPLIFLGTGWALSHMSDEMARLKALRVCAIRLQKSEAAAFLEGARGVREREALRVVMASRFADLAPLVDPERDSLSEWSLNARKGFARSVLQEYDQEKLVRILNAPHAAGDEDAREALLVLGPEFLQDLERNEQSASRQSVMLLAGILMVSAGMIALGSALAIVLAFLLRGGALFRLFGTAVVTSDGAQASRLRVLARASLAWLPGVAGSIGAIFVAIKFSRADVMPGYWMLAGLAVWGIVASIACLATPDRGPHDRLVGTHLVPR